MNELLKCTYDKDMKNIQDDSKRTKYRFFK